MAVGLTACTAGFFYNRLDWLAVWYVNGLVTLDDDQERQLRELVDRNLAWHRRTQLPRYLLLLERLDREVDAPAAPEVFERDFQEVVHLWDEFLEHILGDGARFLSGLSPTQVTELMKGLEEGNEDLRDEYAGASPEVRKSRNARNAIRAIQRFTGRLTPDQRKLVELRLAAIHDVSDEWLERRQHWQQKFRLLLEARPAAEQFEAEMKVLILNPESFDSGEYRARVQENRAVILSMLAELKNALTGEQRARVKRKLQEYAEALRKIAANE
ncbi:MAG: DUF6279 family lipoprotein [Terriglobales bacterium]